MTMSIRSILKLVYVFFLCGCVTEPPISVAAPTTSGTVGSGCTTVKECADTAVLAAQAANMAADRSARAVPVGTVIAFYGTRQEAEAQKQNGWWIANGQTVTDSTSVYFGKKLVDLSGKFLLASELNDTPKANKILPQTDGGSPVATVPAQSVTTRTTGWDGSVTIYSDPRIMICCGGLTWQNGNPITSAGTVPSATIAIIPPYYAVIYLIKVR